MSNNQKTERGDVYQLGKHRLMCGDSTDPNDAEMLMGGARARFLFTSPPYLNMRDYGKNDLRIEVLVKFIPSFEPFTEIQIVNLGLKFENREIIRYWDEYISSAEGCGYKLTAWNVWNKNHPGSIGAQMAMFPLQHEFIFVFSKCWIELNKTIKKLPRNIIDRDIPTTKRRKDGSIERTTQGNMSNEYKKIGSVLSLDLEHNQSTKYKSFPARFPITLPTEYIKAVSNEGDIVIDCFGGSGTTLIACEQLNRICYMMEINPEYIDLIIERWEETTGKTAVKL